VQLTSSIYGARVRFGFAVIALLATVEGCGGNSGDGDSINPGAAADQAIEQFDKDGSGSLNESELAASPGLLAARASYDKDANQEISHDELEEGLASTSSKATSWATAYFRIMQGARPLAGATIRFVPEPFLGESLHEATGTTDNQGRVSPAVADDKLPAKMKGLQVMQPGIYRVEVDHPSVKKPHKPLGCEINEALVRMGTEITLSL
jgi:hypothetical protein